MNSLLVHRNRANRGSESNMMLPHCEWMYYKRWGFVMEAAEHSEARLSDDLISEPPSKLEQKISAWRRGGDALPGNGTATQEPGLIAAVADRCASQFCPFANLLKFVEPRRTPIVLSSQTVNYERRAACHPNFWHILPNLQRIRWVASGS